MNISSIATRLVALGTILSVAAGIGVSSSSTANAETAKRYGAASLEHRGDLARRARQRTARPLKGILKKPRIGRHRLGGGPKKVHFNLKPRRPGPGYGDRQVSRLGSKTLDRRGQIARGARKPATSARSAAKSARHADKARKVRNAARAAKLARGAKYLAAGTGVGAAVGVVAGLAGVDPIEMAALKATDPAEYRRRMAALKKNPLKYMGNSAKNNTRKIGAGIKNGTKKFGQGVKKVFAKKNK